MRRIALLLGVLIVFWIGCATARTPQSAPVTAPPAFPFPVIELTGSPAEIGSAHAKSLGGPIRYLFHNYLGRYFRNPVLKTLAMRAAGSFETLLIETHRDEIRALASAVQMDEREIMLGQCFLDLSPMTACSTIALSSDASPDHVARFGRTLDFTSFDIADKQTVVMIVRPKGANAFASIAWPGMVGVLSGMNEHGLTLANMEVTRSPRLPDAMPYTLLYRTVLERCATVNEAVELLERTPRQTANNLMLMDASGDRAVIELTPQSVVVRRAEGSLSLISTNHQRGQNQSQRGLCTRYDFLNRTSKKSFGETSLPKVESMLAGVGQGDATLQSMVFEPANRVIYLSAGSDAPNRQYYKLELAERFAGK